MDYDDYGSNAVELAIDLANVDRSAEDWLPAFLTAHDEWFTEGTSLDLTAREVKAVASTSDLVRGVARAQTRADVIGGLNALLALAAPRPYATDHDGDLHLHYAAPEAGALDQLTTTVAMGLSQLVVQHGWQRLGVCAAEGCGNVYVDTSRNASRRYCSNTCSSRSTVAAYRARQRS